MVSIRYEETTPISMRVGELPVGELRDESSKKDYECFNTPPPPNLCKRHTCPSLENQ